MTSTVPVATGRLSRWLSAANRAIERTERLTAPLFDVLLRLALAGPFFVSGLLKAADWDKALYLATNEYPVSWLDPATAAVLGVVVELVGSVLLTVGLGTRFAAAAMLTLAVVIQTNYAAQDTTLFWIVLLFGYVVRGAGTLSLDRLIAPGLAASPLPFAAGIVRTAHTLTRIGLPLYVLVLRVWLAVTLAAAAGLVHVPQVATLWIPIDSAPRIGTGGALVIAVLFAPGLGTRFVSVALLFVMLMMQMMDAGNTANMYWLWSLGWLCFGGAGAASIDAIFERTLRHRDRMHGGDGPFDRGLPRVVIVGAGFGGFTLAARLRQLPVSVTLIDRKNYHLFQPLLYQVATAGLAPGDIATPVRGLFRESDNTRVLLAEVTGIDTSEQQVRADGLRIPYDYLVLATGASHSYFGQDAWAPFAPGLKRVEDATEVRRRLLTAFERAETTDDVVERRCLLTFLIVGGGPTGVELAGAIAELARFGMEKEFRHFDPASARVILVQSGPRILPSFPEMLSIAAAQSLRALGVEVRVGSRVQQIDRDGVTVNGERVSARTVLWAAGVVASPAALWLNAEADAAGRLIVTPDLSVPGLPNVFAIGDTALANAWNGHPVPGLAPAAKQSGLYAARVIRARVLGKPHPPPFRYRHLGSLATIGRKSAVADFGFVKLSGAPAWWLWGIVHVGFLVGVRNRVSVMFDWIWSYLTYRRGTRLITGAENQPMAAGLPSPPIPPDKFSDNG